MNINQWGNINTWSTSEVDPSTLSIPLVTSNASVYSPSVLISKVLSIPLINNSGSILEPVVDILKVIGISDIISSGSRIFRLYVLDGNGILIPIEDRAVTRKVAKYLRSLGFKGNNNDVIIQWLTTEGIEKSDYNSMLNSYLISQGYTEGGLNDKYKLWTRG